MYMLALSGSGSGTQAGALIEQVQSSKIYYIRFTSTDTRNVDGVGNGKHDEMALAAAITDAVTALSHMRLLGKTLCADSHSWRTTHSYARHAFAGNKRHIIRQLFASDHM